VKELAEALKAKAGLRMRQGVVSAVDGSTVSVLIGGSTVAVDGVHHLNSVAPQVGEVVWIASDGADLWILGTHGDPPAIDPSRLPVFETYFTAADPAGTPTAVTGLVGATTSSGVLLSWDLPPEAKWRRWEVYEGTASDFTPTTPILTTTATVVAIPRDAGSGPWYYKVRAMNTRDESSADVQVGPLTVAQIGEANLAADSVTAAKIKAGEITAAQLNVADVQAAVVTAAKINTLELNAITITGGDITGVTLTGGVIRTAVSGGRVVIDSVDDVRRAQFFSGAANEVMPGTVGNLYQDDSHAFLEIDGPDFGGGCASIQLSGQFEAVPNMLTLNSSAMALYGAAGASVTLNDQVDGSLILTGGAGAYISVGSAANTVKIFGLLEVTDLVKARVPSCSILRTSSGTISNNTDTNPSLTATATVEWDTDEFFDTDVPDRITIPVAGVYLLDLSFCWAANATGWRSVGIVVGSDIVAHQRVPSPGNVLCMQQVSCVRELAAGDVVKMYCRQTRGGNLTMNANAYAPRLAATWLRQAT
jgi:hypothetical protein